MLGIDYFVDNIGGGYCMFLPKIPASLYLGHNGREYKGFTDIWSDSKSKQNYLMVSITKLP